LYITRDEKTPVGNTGQKNPAFPAGSLVFISDFFNNGNNSFFLVFFMSTNTMSAGNKGGIGSPLSTRRRKKRP
jgi:hypothetical protein